ncbi:hypothetical protein HDU93_008113 [Gonapodya sp. JEL0774]|nr:hypothetical protein HDU93_008113 [Gonapodya sp. JEL0774]
MDKSLTEAELIEIINRFRGPQGVEVKDRFRGFSRFPKSFTANQAIEWIAKRGLPNARLKREAALEIARAMQARGVIMNLTRPGDLIRDDSSLLGESTCSAFPNLSYVTAKSSSIINSC